MNKKNVIILIIGIIIFCLALVFLIFSINSKKENSQNNIEVEEVSKTKDLEDVDYTDFVFYREDRSEVRLSNYKDKPAMILFWNEDTEDAVEMLKSVNEMYEKHKDKINFLVGNGRGR